MEKIELHIVALTNSESHPGSFALILEDVKKSRRIPITIGLTEAQSIAVTLEKMTPKRPQSHDLMHNVIAELGGELVEVIINEIVEEKYHALLIIKQNERQIAIDSRTSDAIALAVRCNCPIYSFENIIKETGFNIDDKGLNMDKRGAFINYPLHELEDLLAKVLAKEDYESATRIRDAISRKKSQ
ncbi:MAG: bifunctional nuclease family protein [Cytophagales bacterium]|nr:bifunctional nuclease family protein [Cytophagales bacterium]